MVRWPLAGVLTLVAILIVPCRVCGVDWTMSRFDEAQTGFTPETLKLPLSIVWEHGTTRFPNNPSSPAVVGGVVYFASGDRVYSVDAATGTLKWRYPAEAALNASIKSTPLVANGKVYFGASDGNLYAVNAADGKYVWAFSTRGAIRSSPVLADGVIYVGSDDNNLYAVDADTGEAKWPGGFRTQDDVAMTPVVAGGLTIFASQDSNLYGVNSVTGKIRWVYRVPAAIRIAPVAAGELVIVGVGNAITCLALRSGQQRWNVPLPSDPAAAPTVGGGVIYVPCKNRTLYALTTAGKPVWPKPVELQCDCSSPPTLAGDTLFVACERGFVSAYDAEKGILKWRIGLMPSLTVSGIQYANASSSPTVANGALYVLTDDGTLRCLRPDGVDLFGPEIYNLTPQRGVSMSGSPPIKFSATLFDTTTGLNPSSIELTLDGKRVDAKFDQQKWQVTYETPVTQPVVPLPDGLHEVALTAADWRGNSTVVTWSFKVDNTLKPPAAPKPAETAKPATPAKPGTTPKWPGPNPPGGRGRFPGSEDSSGRPPNMPPGGYPRSDRGTYEP